MISQENNAESPNFEKAFFFLGGGGNCYKNWHEKMKQFTLKF